MGRIIPYIMENKMFQTTDQWYLQGVYSDFIRILKGYNMI